MPEFMKNSLAKHGIVGRLSRTKAEPIFEEQQESQDDFQNASAVNKDPIHQSRPSAGSTLFNMAQ